MILFGAFPHVQHSQNYKIVGLVEENLNNRLSKIEKNMAFPLVRTQHYLLFKNKNHVYGFSESVYNKVLKPTPDSNK